MRRAMTVTAGMGLLLVVNAGSMPAFGEIVGYKVTGHVSRNNRPDIFTTISEGDAFSGSFKYDSSIEADKQGVQFKVYRFNQASPILGVAFTVNDQTFHGDMTGAYAAITIDDFLEIVDGQSVFRDTLTFEQIAETPNGVPSSENLMFVRVAFTAEQNGSGPSIISEPPVLASSVNLEDWDDRSVSFNIAQTGTDPRVKGIIESLTAVRLGDFDGDELLTAADIDALSLQIAEGRIDPLLDLDHNGVIDGQDRSAWVNGADYAHTYFGDANLDGEFNSGDLVEVFTSGQYEDGIALNSGWATGDWDGDREFTSGDIVAAFQGGGYEIGPRMAEASVVPEPHGLALMLIAVSFVLQIRPGRQ